MKHAIFEDVVASFPNLILPIVQGGGNHTINAIRKLLQANTWAIYAFTYLTSLKRYSNCLARRTFASVKFATMPQSADVAVPKSYSAPIVASAIWPSVWPTSALTT
jgi:hypothetical protein